jgi:hypothetical protein
MLGKLTSLLEFEVVNILHFLVCQHLQWKQFKNIFKMISFSAQQEVSSLCSVHNSVLEKNIQKVLLY